MSLLLDTCAFLWFVGGDAALPVGMKTRIEREEVVLVSIGTAWEIAIKASLGRLELAMPPGQFFHERMSANRFELLPIRPAHLDRLALLPFYHRDPFDRHLIAQGVEEELPIVTADESFDLYSVQRTW